MRALWMPGPAEAAAGYAIAQLGRLGIKMAWNGSKWVFRKAGKVLRGQEEEAAQAMASRFAGEFDGASAASAKAERQAVNEAIEARQLRVTGKTGAGVVRPDRHHIFPQDKRDWFKDRGVDIDQYTLPLNEGTHSAIHTFVNDGRGWNEEIMKRLTAREAELERRLTRREILQIGADMRRFAKLQNVKVVPFVDP
jgi:hypothetical protein